jgi:hypothetical protein
VCHSGVTVNVVDIPGDPGKLSANRACNVSTRVRADDLVADLDLTPLPHRTPLFRRRPLAPSDRARISRPVIRPARRLLTRTLARRRPRRSPTTTLAGRFAFPG